MKNYSTLMTTGVIHYYYYYYLLMQLLIPEESEPPLVWCLRFDNFTEHEPTKSVDFLTVPCSWLLWHIQLWTLFVPLMCPKQTLKLCQMTDSLICINRYSETISTNTRLEIFLNLPFSSPSSYALSLSWVRLTSSIMVPKYQQ